MTGERVWIEYFAFAMRVTGDLNTLPVIDYYPAPPTNTPAPTSTPTPSPVLFTLPDGLMRITSQNAARLELLTTIVGYVSPDLRTRRVYQQPGAARSVPVLIDLRAAGETLLLNCRIPLDSAMVFSPNGRYIVIATDSSYAIALYDIHQGRSLTLNSDATDDAGRGLLDAFSVVFSADSRYFALPQIEVWDILARRPNFSAVMHTPSFALSPDGSEIAVSGMSSNQDEIWAYP